MSPRSLVAAILALGLLACPFCGSSLAADKDAKAGVPKADAPKAATPAEKGAKVVHRKASVVEFTLKGEFPEGPQQPGLFSEIQPSLSKFVERMDEAAKDKAVDAVILRVAEAELGRATVDELRAAVARIRKAGKPVYAELVDADSRAYLLACACDSIYLAPGGTLMIPGVRAEMTYYKGLLDKLGIEVHVLQMGKYKSAGEPYTRTEPSPAAREEMTGIVDDLYQGLVATVAKDRKLDEAQVRKLIDEGIFTAAEAKKAGLVDVIGYADDIRDLFRAKLNAEKVDFVSDYKKEKNDLDFSGIGGMMKLMEMAFGGKTAGKTSAQRKIAVVYAVGVIVQGKSGSSFMGDDTVGSTSMVEALRKADQDPKVLAVVLRIDSPGGSAVASDLIWRQVDRMHKPVIASMANVAASGGYYIAAPARRIIAQAETITGSIGVIGGKPVISKLLDKVGISTEVVSRGKNSGMLSVTSPFTPDEQRAWTKIMEETYGQFVAKVAEGRKMPRAKVEELAQGRVYTGKMALEKGLIDGLGTLEDALRAAKEAAGLKPDEKVELETLPEPKTFFEQLFDQDSAMTQVRAALPELSSALTSAALIRRVFREPSLFMMPYRVEIK
jgi:protease-4